MIDLVHQALLGWAGLAVVALGAAAYVYGFVVKKRSARWLDTLGLCCALFALALLSSSLATGAFDPRAVHIVVILLCIVTLAQGRAALSDRRSGASRED